MTNNVQGTSDEEDPWKVVGSAEKFPAAFASAMSNLNAALADFEGSTDPIVKEVHGIKLQAAIFQYDLGAEMIGLLNLKPSGFVLQVALRTLVLRLFEFHDVSQRVLLPRIRFCAKQLGLPFDSERAREMRLRHRDGLKIIEGWHEVRNHAAGHYGKDLERQVASLKTLTLASTIDASRSMMEYNLDMMTMLIEIIGQSKSHRVAYR